MELEGQVEGAEMGLPRCRFQDAFFCSPRNSWFGFILQLFCTLLMWRKEAVKQRAAENSKVIRNRHEPKSFWPIGGKERRSLYMSSKLLGETLVCVPESIWLVLQATELDEYNDVLEYEPLWN